MNSLLTHVDSSLRSVDYTITSMLSGFVPDTPCLEVFLFHPVFNDKSEIAQNLVSPFEKFEVRNFRELIEFYLENEYKFVSPQDLYNGLNPLQKFIGLTFDDGYANNLRLVPLLKEYEICATFFIATHYVMENKPFWWDVVMHFRAQQGIPRLKTLRERNHLKTLRHDEIDEYLYHEFGPQSQFPPSELARPMSAAELADFAKEDLVHLGNHTHNHAILTNYDIDGITSQINQCQVAIHEMTGVTAMAISYPDGKYSDKVVAAAQRAGLSIGITTNPLRNIPPPTESEHLMRIDRPSLSGEFNIRHQCRALRIGFSPFQKLRSLAIKSIQMWQPAPFDNQ